MTTGKKHRLDWIEQMNDLAEAKGWDDRMMCELFIMFLDAQKKGDAFFKWMQEEAKKT